MNLFAILFALLMITGAFAAAALTGIVAGWPWGALVALGIAVMVWRGMKLPAGPASLMRRETLNAFQQPLARDD